LYRRAFLKLRTVFFQNEDDRDLFVERRLINSAQARLLPGSGIDLDRFSATTMPSPDRPIFLLIARLLRDKGVMEFVQAARLVKVQYPSARFQLLGALGAQNRTAIDPKVIQSWIEEGVVEHLGTTPDVRPFITSASCVVLPSYREGAPRTLIEAAAMGRPVITTDVPGCRSVVDKDRSGFLCDVRNADSLADAMKRFIELSEDARGALGVAGRRKMEKEFDQAIVVRSYRAELLTYSYSR
jgi:glycosyltransferase involved in cell wall biosynthesis